ncbi:MAG: efflux RND transporter periplasmic adaptor subunit [Rhodospirillales bacterium]|nr:efflux RND transporter periplasmic adaptor subunit [Rhodospirillales bacterium]
MAVAPLAPTSPLPTAPPIRAARAEAPTPPGPRRWRRALPWVAGLVAVLAIAGWFARVAMTPLTVQPAPVGTEVAEQVFGLGVVGADVQSGIGFKVAGVIAEIDANQGDRVRAGQVLARLDARDVAAQLDQARASVALARAALGKAEADVAAAEASYANAAAVAARRQALAKGGFASVEETETTRTAMRVAKANRLVAASEVATAQAGLAAARAQREYAEATLGNYTLRAPYDAWIVARGLNRGAMPVPGQAVFTVVDPRSIWVVAYIDERSAGRLHVGQSAALTLRSEPGRSFAGHVARIEMQSDSVNEERVVDIAFDRLPADIHLAEQAYATITTGALARATLVPQTAIAGLDGDSGTVWTLERGKLARRRVTFGPQLLDGRMPVLAGLTDGAAVVLPRGGMQVGRAARLAPGAGR